MALLKPDGLLGIHTNMPATVPPDVSKALASGGPKPEGLSADEDRAYEILKHFFATGVGLRQRDGESAADAVRHRRLAGRASRPGCSTTTSAATS